MMKARSLAVVCCPACRHDLRLEHAGDGPNVETGTLTCSGCAKSYPIRDGIPRFAARQELVGQNKIAYWVQNLDSYAYDQTVKLMSLALGIQEEPGRREYLSRLEAPSHAKILEVAIGPGPNLPYLREMFDGAEFYGLDLSPGMLRQCVKNVTKWSLPTELFQGLAEQVPFKDNTFDVVFQVGGINNFRDKQRAIEEMIRVAKPGTKIIIVDEWLHPERTPRRLVRLLLRALPALYRHTEPPAALVPATATETQVEPIWNGCGYCLEFRKLSLTRQTAAHV
jgi:ubiquinone/menaquinone biosynthesis C-methylase UbiE/uncharacterized protein YbaR (Trm112 family)